MAQQVSSKLTVQQRVQPVLCVENLFDNGCHTSCLVECNDNCCVSIGDEKNFRFRAEHILG